MNKVEVSPNATLVSDKCYFSQDTPALESLIGMLEKVLLQVPGYAQANKKPHTNRLPKVEGSVRYM